MFQITIPYPQGALKLSFEDKQLVELKFLKTSAPLPELQDQKEIKKAVQLLFQFFKRPHDFSTLKYELRGTPFQHKVWAALKKIPAGQTRTYGELAKQLKTSARAIGVACRTNPIPLVVPCHRVVSASSMGGFCGQATGEWPRIKSWLLDFERETANTN